MACNYPHADSCGDCVCEVATVGESQAYNFNRDPEWEKFVQRYETTIEKIAVKYCSVDEDLRNDVKQEARIALRTVFPNRIRGYETLTSESWFQALDRYCRNVIRNSILSYLNSYPKGNWYIGRTRHVKDRATGATRKVYMPPRFSSLDELVDNYGMQVDESGSVSWPDPSDDGLPGNRSSDLPPVNSRHGRNECLSL